MAISEYLKNLRARVGNELLMVPAVVAVILDDQDRVLVQKRTDGGWSLPAGAMDPGETAADAIIREVREETGLIVRPTHLLGVFGGGPAFRLTYSNGDVSEYLCVVFRCEVIGGTLGGLDDETAGLEYVAPAEMPALRMPYPKEIFLRDAPIGQFHLPTAP